MYFLSYLKGIDLEKFKELTQFIKETYPEKDFIPLHEPFFDQSDENAVAECVRSTFVSSVGVSVNEIENMVANYCGAKFGVAVVNGTAALHIALVVAGVQENDEVITQALTFVATANAIKYCGAEPLFLDASKESLGLDPKALEKFFGENTFMDNEGRCINKSTERVIKACVPMHTFGHPVHMEEILSLCRKYNVLVIEDAAEALGSSLSSKKAGNLGDIGIFSFNGNKIITCGGGGIITTDNEEFARRAKHLTTTAKRPHDYEFFHDEIGYNYRMPNLNASLACSQMEKLESFLLAKRSIAQAYKTYCSQSGIKFLDERAGTNSNFWLNAVILDSIEERDFFLRYSNSHQVMTRPIWKLISDLPPYKHCYTDDLANSRYLYERVVNLPSSVSR